MLWTQLNNKNIFHICDLAYVSGQSGFLTFTDYVGLDTDILITF